MSNLPESGADALRETVQRALGSQYDVLQLLGRGGMGAVYLARERLLDRLVAVKVLPHDAAADETGRERFLREARTAARLSHPNIVPLHSFAEADGTLLYVMGFVQGESLEARLAREGRIPGDESRRILAEIADALDYAHGQGVVHRDVKPDNILIDWDTGRAVLTDFGIAKQVTRQGTLTQTGMVVGSPQYMSPEQATAEPVDGRSDIYSLGVVGYRMLSGRLPFVGGTMRELLAAQVAGEPEPLSAPDSEASVAAAVMRCLRKSPADRWPTARAFSHALKAGDLDAELSDELAAIPSLAVKLGFGGFAIAVAVGAIHSYSPSADTWRVLLFLPVVQVTVLAVALVQARRAGVAWRRAARMSLWAPASWWGWWPVKLRRPGDVWLRLPTGVRRARALLTAAFAVIGGVLVPSLVTLLASVAGDGVPNSLLGRLFVYGGPASMALLLGGIAMTVPWERRFGLKAVTARGLTSEPTWNNERFWGRAEVAALLEGGSEGEVHTPRRLAELIVKDVSALPDAIRGIVREAGDAGRDLARAIVAIDAELAEVRKHAAEDERQRVVEGLSALPILPNEPESRRQMRQLLAGQLRILDGMESRRQELHDDRERYLLMLRQLWHQVATLKADTARDLRGVPDITGRVQAICDEVAIQRAARDSLGEFLETATPMERVDGN
jgi:hypothetical protein